MYPELLASEVRLELLLMDDAFSPGEGGGFIIVVCELSMWV